MFPFFAYISRLKYINRWSLMRNSVTENVQEHSHMAAVLAHALGVIRRDVFGKPCDPNACAAAALFHDAPEIFTGDLPTPIKYFNPALQDAYHRVEDAAAQKLLSLLPDSMRPAYEPLLLENHPEIRGIVKAADKLCAYIKCVEELAVGNSEFSDAARVTAEALEQLQMEEVSWFLEHFGPAFGLTLDGLR